MPGPKHSIKVVARMTGLSSPVIRVWEKRYRAVTPGRTESNRRLYSDAEVERLNLLRRATELGHSIGAIARLGSESLRNLVQQTEQKVQANGTGHAGDPLAASTASGNGHGDNADAGNGHAAGTLNDAPDGPRLPVSPLADPAGTFMREATGAACRFDGARLEATLREAKLTLGIQGLLRRVVAPLSWAIGDLWHRGEITAAHEHFACGVIRVFLGAQIASFVTPATAPVVIVTTPAGQLHEMGAVIAAAAAAANGWRVTYLGPCLPAAEIAGAALQNHAHAVALSIVYPEDDPELGVELEKLRRYLPPEIRLVVGGRAAAGYRRTLQQIGATECANLDDLDRALAEIRVSRHEAPAGKA